MNAPISDEDYLWNKRHELIYKVEQSGLYHQKRERFFELCDKLAKVVAVVGGSAALWKIADPGVVQWIAFLITFSSAFSLVFSFSDRARRHAELSKTYRQILAEIMAKGERDFTEADLNEWLGKIYVLEATEPPTLATLTVLCQNEIAIANNQPEKVRQIGFWRRRFAHLY
jgi:hypothetical protein